MHYIPLFQFSKGPWKNYNLMRNSTISYFSASKLSVNFKKTHYMTIFSPQKANRLKLNLRNIEEKNYIKYLGIYIDKNLNWAPHIQHINSKISKNLGILFRLRHFLTLNTLKQIYYSLIYPYLHYGIMSWGNTYPSRLTKVQTKQNKCIRCIFFSHNRESSAPYRAGALPHISYFLKSNRPIRLTQCCTMLYPIQISVG